MSAGPLLHERTLIVQPSLVRALGLREAIVLQQLHWHLGTAGHGQEHEGEVWFPITYSEFAAELGLTADVVRRSIEALTLAGVVHWCQPEGWSSRRKWYRIDYSHTVLQVADPPDGSGDDAASSSGETASSPSTKTTKRSASRPRFEEFDALVAVWGEPGTREEAAFFARTARSLQSQEKSPAEILDRGKRAKQRHPDCTVNVLLTRWSNFAPPANGRGKFNASAARAEPVQ